MDLNSSVSSTSGAIGAKCTGMCAFLIWANGIATATMPLVQWLSFALAGLAAVVSIYLGLRSLRKKPWWK